MMNTRAIRNGQIDAAADADDDVDKDDENSK